MPKRYVLESLCVGTEGARARAPRRAAAAGVNVPWLLPSLPLSGASARPAAAPALGMGAATIRGRLFDRKITE